MGGGSGGDTTGRSRIERMKIAHNQLCDCEIIGVSNKNKLHTMTRVHEGAFNKYQEFLFSPSPLVIAFL